MLHYCLNLKGTPYEEKLKSGESREFYAWVEQEIMKHYKANGWEGEFAKLWIYENKDINLKF